MKSVLEYLETAAAAYPDRYVYMDPERQYTFSETLRIARSVGSRIGRLRAPGRPVALFMEKSADMAAAILGVLYGGCCYCPIDTAMPKERMRRILEVLEPAAAVTEPSEEALVSELGLSCPVYSFDSLRGESADDALLAAIREECRDTDPLYVLFTSGSTGVPKGVLGCQRMILNNLEWLAAAYPYGPEDVLGNQVPFHFVISLHDIFVPLRFGCGTFIIPQEYFSYPARLVECLNSRRVTSIFWVPSALAVTARLNGFDKQMPAYLRYVFFIGEVMPVRELNYWRSRLPGARYVNMYGSTETHVSLSFELDREYGERERIPIGHPCANVRAVILDERNRPVPKDGGIGELCVGGAALSLGYYRDPEKTRERFIECPPGAGAEGLLYRTGDLAAYGPDGEILYRGRTDQQIKRMGYRIELGEIEAAAAAYPGIRECACVYRERDQYILLLYTAAEKLDSRQISGALAARIPRYMMPNRYIFLESMPRNANGKIDRRGLKETYAEGR